jgi:hypothetical protein
MALEATFRELTASLQRLHDAVNGLHITLEDKPLHDEAAVADDLTDRALELLGLVHDARRAAVRSRQALRPTPDLDKARRSLTLCQQRFHKIEQSYAADLASFQKLKELVRVGRRGKEWSAWAASTKQSIEQCRAPLDAASQALAACWQELAERLGTMNISIQSTNVGQEISVPKSKVEVEEPEVEGVT